MFVRYHERMAKREEGFTLIELLVVVLIIAILAAIAVPVFLQQRIKGWRSQSQSALKNAATAQESYATANNGVYTAVVANLEAEGFKGTAPEVVISAALTAAGGYCITAVHAQLTTAADAWATSHFASTAGRPVAGACP